MAKRIELPLVVREPVAREGGEASYDLGLWAAGYEARSSWLVQSRFRPQDVRKWLKAEFTENRDVHGGERSRSVKCGELFGGKPGKQNHDGRWAALWDRTVETAAKAAGRRIDVFVDYSSMPRALYGTILVQSLTALRKRIRSITFAYVPGHHSAEVNGSRGVTGLRPLIGTEGHCVHGRTAFVLGLGYDGILSETMVELFQMTQFSCLYGDPAAGPDGVNRVVSANASVLSRADVVSTAAAMSVQSAAREIERLCDWYSSVRDVLLVLVGPKPHVLAGVLVAAVRQDVGFRFPQTSAVRPSDVVASPGVLPAVTVFEVD